MQSLPILGYLVSHGKIKPDPERLLPLKNLVAPCDLDSQRRIVGMFAYYSRWIPKYSEKICPLNTNRTFPLSPEALKTFQSLKEEIEVATLMTPLEGVQLEVETDVSDYAIQLLRIKMGDPLHSFPVLLPNQSIIILRSRKKHVLLWRQCRSGDPIFKVDISN